MHYYGIALILAGLGNFFSVVPLQDVQIPLSVCRDGTRVTLGFVSDW